MIIDKIEVYNYGKLSHLSLNLKQFQIIYGKNEAGKTTLLNFIEDMLFGFNKTNKTHPYAPKDKSKMSGKLHISSDKINFFLERTEGPKGGVLKLSDDKGNSLPDTVLKDILGPINRDTYENIYYFGAPNLKEIAKLSKDELTKRIQHIGVVGIENWLSLKKDLKKKADEIYLSSGRGKKQLINQELKKLDQVKDGIKRATASYSDFDELKDQANEVKIAIQKNHQQLADTNKQLATLKDDKKNWNSYIKLQQLEAGNNKIKTGFNQEDYDNLHDLLNKISVLQKDIGNDKENIDTYKENNQSNSKKYQFYNDNQTQISNLASQLDTEFELLHQRETLLSDLKQEKKRMADDAIEAGGKESIAFDDATKSEVDDLLAKNQTLKSQLDLAKQNMHTRKPAENKKQTANYVMSFAGVLILALSFAIASPVKFIGILIGIALIVWGFFNMTSKQNKQENITAFNSDDLQTQSNAINDKLAKIAEHYHISNIPSKTWTTSLQFAIKRRDTGQQRINELNEKFDNLDHKISSYLTEWNFATDVLNLNGISNEAKFNRIKQFISEMKDQERHNSDFNQHIQVLQSTQDNHQKQLNEVKSKVNEFLQKRSLENSKQFDEEFSSQKEVIQRGEQLKQLQNELSDVVLQRLKNYADLDDLNQKIKNVENKINDLNQKNIELSSKEPNIDNKIRIILEDGKLADLRQEETNLETNINDLLSRWLTYELTNQWIDKVLDKASHGRLPKVQSLSQKYFNILTNGHYKKMKFGKKIKLITNDKSVFEIKELSRGTTLQLYLALIFALTESFSDEFPLPILIDDGFVDFDHVRTDNAIDLMKQISQKTQVIYFTSDDRIAGAVSKNEVEKLL